MTILDALPTIRRGEKSTVAHGAPAHAAPTPGRWPIVLEVAAVTACVLTCWAASSIEPSNAGDTGLAPLLPAAYWAGLVILNISFGIALARRDTPTRTYIVLLGCLIFTLFGVASFASPIPRTEAAWRHLGVIDHLIQSGRVDSQIDAYFNWPGFFALGALGFEAAGVRSALGVVLWAPIWNNILWVLAASLPLRALTSDRRRLWLALWIFCLCNWIDQDYFSPQAFAYFLYLVILGMVLWFLRAVVPVQTHAQSLHRSLRGLSVWWRERQPAPGTTPKQRQAALLLVMLLSVVMAVSHQLTPVALVLSVAALVVSGRCYASRLPLLMALALVLWYITGASGYLAGHPVVSFDQIEKSAGQNVTDRLAGSHGHLFVVRLRIAFMLATSALAAVGAIRRRRSGRSPFAIDLVPVVLAGAPYLLVPAQSYGGEGLLRASLYSMPFMALLVAGALLGDKHRPDPQEPVTVVTPQTVAAGGPALCTVSAADLSSIRPPAMAEGVQGTTRPSNMVARSILIVVVGSLLAVVSLTVRYGNARFDMFNKNETAAVAQLYRVAPQQGVLVSAAHPTPWQWEHYDDYRYTTMQTLCRKVEVARCAETVLSRIRRSPVGGAVIFLRSGVESLRMQGLMRPADVSRVEREIQQDPRVHKLAGRPDARIYIVGADQ